MGEGEKVREEGRKGNKRERERKEKKKGERKLGNPLDEGGEGTERKKSIEN